jgi:GT2 family glycosyltransferase
MDSPAISVAICTRNRRASLLETLETLAGQHFDRAWETLVVDNGSEDGTSDAVRSRAGRFPVPLRCSSESELGVAFARNRALREARAPVVLFVDDDVSCDAGLIVAHADALAEPDVVATGGRIVPVVPPGTPAWKAEVLLSDLGGPASRYDFGPALLEISRRGPVALPFCANVGVKRERALGVGGFRTDLGWGRRAVPSEDVDLFRRLRRQGGRLLYVPAAVVRHRIGPERTTRDYDLSWNRGYGRSQVLMNPPRGLAQHLGRVASSAHRVLLHGGRALRARRRGDPVAELWELRRRSRNEGQLLELLRSASRRSKGAPPRPGSAPNL